MRIIRRRIALGVLAVVVLSTAVVWRRAALHRSAIQSWAATSSVILRLTGGAARAWITERDGDVHLLTGQAGRSPALFKIAVPGTPLIPDARLRTGLASTISQLQHAHGPQYTRIWIFDAHGRPLISSSGRQPSPAVRAAATAALVTDSVFVGSLYERTDGSTGIAFAQRVVYSGPGHPASVPADGVLGTVALVVDPSASLFPSLEGGSIRSDDEATMLLMAHGDSVYEYALDPTAQRVSRVVARQAVPDFERQALDSTPDEAAHLSAGEIMLVRPVQGTPWAVLRRARPAAVFAAADARLVGECGTVAVLAGIAVWLLLLRSRMAQARRAREVAASEQRYRLVTDNAMDVIARHDASGRVDYVSPAITWVLGYDPGEIVGRTLADLGHPADAAAIATLFANARRQAGTSRVEHRLRDASGNDVWVETLARAVDTDDPDEASAAASSPTEIVTVTRDISTRKDAEHARRDALEFVRALVESSPVAIVALDLDGRVVQWNGAAEQLFGWSAADVIGQPYPLAPGLLREEMERLRDRTVIHEHLSDVAVRRQRKDGTLIDVSISTGVIHGAGGIPSGFVVLAIDLAERVKLEAQLRQSQKMEAVGLLAGGIAHDFNNLLTVVTSYSSLLLRDVPEGDPMREDLSEIHGAAKRGAALVGQLLAFSRQQVLTPQPVDVNALVANMKPLLKRVLPSKITLKQMLGNEAGVIEADPGQIEQVLMNLVVNARDAIGDVTGSITITTACDPPYDADGALLDAESREVVVTVCDTGCGMPSHLLEQIFDPFFTTKERGQGTGLGLSTVQGIVAQSGGRISVRSEPGVGTQFELRFPACTGDPVVLDSTHAIASTDAGPGSGGAVILLVEDDARVRRATTRICESAGFEVIAAADATEALTIYEEQAARIDVIVTDMMMPDLTGAELIARIRACGYDVPALFISGHTTPGPLAASAVDGSRFLQKPFSPDELAAKVRELLARRVAASSTWAIPTRGQLTRS